ncbi:MAG: SDR family NAD(P)-dependent oxidoreductase [bacterium]|nr:SDR family NAD(P)-dependent oxidoreductase [bacterium]
MNDSRPTAVVTGASSGIGRASAVTLAKAGFDVILAARRESRLEKIAAEIGGRAIRLDVVDPKSIEAFAAQCPAAIDVLVNNAGGALGLDPVESGSDEDWIRMWQTNVLGVARLTRALLPALRRSPSAHILMLGSTAGFETYPGGAGYTSSKHALRAVTRTLRLELLGEPIRLTEIAPGMVETEFSINRFYGDRDRADAVYRGLTPLVAEDVAQCVLFAVTRPAHVNIDEIVVRPVDQATSTAVHRRKD